MAKKMNDDKLKERLKKPAKNPAGGVFDVRRPGKAIASPTSRPVITGHKPEAQAAQTAVSGVGETSPMLNRRKIQIMPGGNVEATEEVQPVETQVTDAEGTPVPEEEQEALGSATLDAVVGPPDLPSGEEKPAPTKSERKIEPLTTDEPKPEEKSEPTEEAAPADESEKLEPEQESGPEAAKDEKSVPDLADTEKATAAELETSPPAETTATAEGEQPKLEGEAEAPKPEPNIKPLFDASGVIVSAHHHRRSRHGLKAFLLVLLILLLAAAGLNIALDLGLLDLPYEIPHTDLL